MFTTIKFSPILFVVLIALLASCSKDKEDLSIPSEVKIVDEFNLISDKTKNYLMNEVTFPDDILVLVRTIDTIEPSIIGSYASSQMEKEEWWREVNPKGLYSRWIKQDKPWSNGVYIVVSQEPHLIQIRYGERIRLEAYRAGLAVGNKYSDMQANFVIEPTDEGVINTAERVSKELPDAMTIPWHLRLMKFIVAVTFSEFEELATPSNDVYTSWILTPYLKLLVLLGGLHSKWLFLTLNMILFFIIDYAVIAIVTNLFLRKKKASLKLRWKKYASLIISTFFSVPFFGATILLSGARIEDVLAIQQIGIVIPEGFGLGMEWFMNVNGFWFALLITFINFINLIITDPLKDGQVLYFYGSPDSASRHIQEMAQGQPTFYYSYTYTQVSQHKYVIKYEEYIYRPSLSLLVFLLFMPKAIGMVALLKQVFDFVTLIPSFFNSSKISVDMQQNTTD